VTEHAKECGNVDLPRPPAGGLAQAPRYCLASHQVPNEPATTGITDKDNNRMHALTYTLQKTEHQQ
jgi:hypothetical protein